MYVIKDETQKIVGAGYSDDTGQGAYLEGLAIDPKFQGEGAGTAFLSEMKRRYATLSLKPIPHSRTEHFTFDELERKLRRFYQRNGFVSARGWSRATISLADETSAGSWHKIDFEEKCVGLENETLYPANAFANIFESILADPELQVQFSSEAIILIRKAATERQERLRLMREFEETQAVYHRARRSTSADKE